MPVTAESLVFGGHAIARRLGRTGIPDRSITETSNGEGTNIFTVWNRKR
ncbi:hypothetical protein [Streptomyces sp. NPDC007070]